MCPSFCYRGPEYDELPVRHNEDKLNAEFAEHCPLEARRPYQSMTALLILLASSGVHGYFEHREDRLQATRLSEAANTPDIEASMRMRVFLAIRWCKLQLATVLPFRK